MKIALFGATGMVGTRLAAEATARGHEVTGLSRSTGGDLADPAAVRDAAASHDVIVSATGPSRTGAPNSAIFMGGPSWVDVGNESHGNHW